MGINEGPVEHLRAALVKQDRTYAWLSRATGIVYKRLLAEVKYGSRPLSLEVALAASDALGLTVDDLVPVVPGERAEVAS